MQIFSSPAGVALLYPFKQPFEMGRWCQALEQPFGVPSFLLLDLEFILWNSVFIEGFDLGTE